jgi:hypothetical protein
MELAPMPSSNTIVLACHMTNASRLGTLKWLGSPTNTWTQFTTPIINAAMNNSAIAGFDMAWTRSGNKLYIGYAQNAVNYLTYRTWTPPAADWSGASGALATLNLGMPAYMIRAAADGQTDQISFFATGWDNSAVEGGQLFNINIDSNGTVNNSGAGGIPAVLATYLPSWSDLSVAASSGTLVYPEMLNTPSYRTNKTSDASWNTESLANYTGSGARWTVLKSAPAGRNEKILVTLDNQGNLQAQVWTSGSGWGSVRTLATGLDLVVRYRPFDVEYERATGKAVVFYANSNVPSYQTWDGSSWNSGTFPNVSQTGQPWWIKAKRNPNPVGNDIMIAALDATATGPNLWAYTWNGTSVPAHTAVKLSSGVVAPAITTPNWENFDIAWEGLLFPMLIQQVD